MIDDKFLDALAALEQRQSAIEQEVLWLACEEQSLSSEAQQGKLNIARFKVFTARSGKAAIEVTAVLEALDALVGDMK